MSNMVWTACQPMFVCKGDLFVFRYGAGLQTTTTSSSSSSSFCVWSLSWPFPAGPPPSRDAEADCVFASHVKVVGAAVGLFLLLISPWNSVGSDRTTLMCPPPLGQGLVRTGDAALSSGCIGRLSRSGDEFELATHHKPLLSPPLHPLPAPPHLRLDPLSSPPLFFSLYMSFPKLPFAFPSSPSGKERGGRWTVRRGQNSAVSSPAGPGFRFLMRAGVCLYGCDGDAIVCSADFAMRYARCLRACLPASTKRR
ncbi:hypothetical protein LY76DRAFT_175895 [Colletotrichum caudatum]|nr:hypothetical protein LY76DRAFT_175895 [Colletotrichum caudatum]